LTFAFVLSSGVATMHARQKARATSRDKKSSAPAQQKSASAEQKSADAESSDLARLRAQLVQATKDYKSSLEQLIDLYEAEVKRADERVDKTKELYDAGLVSKRDLEKEQNAAAEARARVAIYQGQLKNADVQIAETVVEAETEEAAAKALAKAKSAPRASGGLITTTAYIRFGGTRSWSLGESGAVLQFFASKFGRQLPVSSFGQSPVHDRWGFDHHNAMDVGVSPDSVEGRALMEYLRAGGIPFTAFRFAIPGTATGPHIHVGRPSHKIAPR
jgi:parvulin-like peptidyl-prolyl isomerase